MQPNFMNHQAWQRREHDNVGGSSEPKQNKQKRQRQHIRDGDVEVRDLVTPPH